MDDFQNGFLIYSIIFEQELKLNPIKTMKKNFLFLILLFISCNVLHAQDFIHATYLVGHSLNDANQVRQIDYRQFQYIYLMAAPEWNKVDFKQPEEEIIRQLVIDHQYIKDKDIQVVPLLIEEAHKNDTKVLLSFAGEGFMERVASTEQRNKFINMMIRFIDKYGYDGIEIDWESDLSLPLHADFMADIRMRLDSLENKKDKGKHLYLTTALHSWQVYNQELANKLSPNVDWINIMSYDMGGGIWGNTAKHNTPLDQMEKELKNWEVFNRNQLCIGLANYGFIYKNLTPGKKIEGKLDKYGSYFSYNNMLPLLQEGWTEEYDDKAKVSYYYSPDRSEFVTMENPETILTKIQWTTAEKYRGVFWWEFSYDMIYPKDSKNMIRHHLIDVVSKYLKDNPPVKAE